MTGQLEALQAALADRYELVRELGSGGMAIVHLARDLKHDRDVALKVLRPELGSSVDTDRFLSEIQTTANLRHPHIVPLFDSGLADGLVFYVMPYLDGQSLQDRMAGDGPLPITECVRIGVAIARALEHAHRQGVLHRDIKPANILLQDGEPVVADFGVAMALHDVADSRLTQTGLSPGTPMYMSPEQAAAERELTAASDVYALACVVYEMLTGEPPHGARGAAQMMAARVAERPAEAAALRSEVPAELSSVLDRALATAPEDRFESAEDFADALDRASRPVATTSGGTRRGPFLAIAATLVGVAAIVGLTRGDPAVTAEDIATIERFIDQSDYMSAYAVAVDLVEVAPDDTVLARLWGVITRPVDIETEPSGATVRWSEYGEMPARILGQTPILEHPIPRGLSSLSFELEGYRDVITAGGTSFRTRPIEKMRLFPEDSLPDDLVWVPGFALPDEDGTPMPPFFLDRYEVSNREYKEFVDAGGYQDERYWQHAFVRDGVEVSWNEAMAEFVDQTGRPGPSTWEVSSYPEGDADLPVGGIGWYEAAAYAAFRGRDLATVHHWRHAAPSDGSPWITPASNIAGTEVLPVGAPRGLSRYGAYDMAGNVREWAYNEGPDGRHYRGGSWADDPYLYTHQLNHSPFDRSAVNGVRLATYPDRTNLEVAQREALPTARDYDGVAPASDEVFASYRRLYDYDDRPLDTRHMRTDTTRLWIRELVSVDAGYSPNRLLLNVYRPLEGTGPFQSVVYFPGGSALGLPTTDAFVRMEPVCAGTCRRIAFLLRSGRTLVFPVYAGLFERSDEVPPTPGAGDARAATVAFRDAEIMRHKDIRRTVDYLLSREDIDPDGIAYMGTSWGGWRTSVTMAIEPRLRAGIAEIGGLARYPVHPEIDPINFVKRVQNPVLMLNGRYDPLYPVDRIAGPMYELLPLEHLATKKMVVEDGGHFVPPLMTARETLAWLDTHLGPVER